MSTHNCSTCRRSNPHYEPTLFNPVYCVAKTKHMSRTDVEYVKKNGCLNYSEE